MPNSPSKSTLEVLHDDVGIGGGVGENHPRLPRQSVCVFTDATLSSSVLRDIAVTDIAMSETSMFSADVPEFPLV